MATLPPGPLGPADLEGLNAQLKALDEADRIIDMGVRGGIDMAAQQVRSRELREQLVRLKQAFFPGQ